MIYKSKPYIFENNIHLKNDDQCTTHSDFGKYLHFLRVGGVYIKALCFMQKRLTNKKTEI